ncbi:MAG TPA: HDOD domain-containing protein [Vicinamibacterales bacterium]|nr:HDOD domain-containing protein [Vicinamibacterales bacterium]
MSVLVARQPILDRERRVFAYELLMRPIDAVEGVSSYESQTAGPAIADLIRTIGFETLTNGKPAFIDLDASQHLDEHVLPGPRRIVVEVPGVLEADPRVIDACRELRDAGYAVALEDFVMSESGRKLLEVADFAKMDFLSTPSHQAEACLAVAKSHDAALIATRVEATEVFDEAIREGFTHVQGYFFEQPKRQPGGILKPNQMIALRLLRALGDPDLGVAKLEDLVKRDAALSHRVLRMANSAALAQAREVTSIGHALMLVGRDTVRRWASYLAMADLSAGAHRELLLMAVVRARFCELLARARDGEDAGGGGFLVGLCSLLDVMLDRPMASVLEELSLAPDIVSALVGHDNPWRQLLDSVIAYERADWETCLPLARQAGLSRDSLPKAYLEALRWGQELRAPVAA